ncbi:MAG: LPS-assembly protein LptD, partial [Bacteroidales bacterium]
KFNPQKMEYDYKLNQNLSISGNLNLTQNWSMNMSTSWDFDRSRLAFMNLGITRNLHCWSMSANIVPVGNFKSYNFSIAVNSSLLKDLKWDKRGNSGEAIPWY